MHLEELRLSFAHACRDGDLETAKYFAKMDDGLLKHYNMDNEFAMACAFGHLEICKYLVGNFEVQPYKLGLKPLCLACQTGQYDVVEWFVSTYLSVGTTIRAYEDIALRNASGGPWEVVFMLIRRYSAEAFAVPRVQAAFRPAYETWVAEVQPVRAKFMSEVAPELVGRVCI